MPPGGAEGGVGIFGPLVLPVLATGGGVVRLPADALASALARGSTLTAATGALSAAGGVGAEGGGMTGADALVESEAVAEVTSCSVAAWGERVAAQAMGTTRANKGGRPHSQREGDEAAGPEA